MKKIDLLVTLLFLTPQIFSQDKDFFEAKAVKQIMGVYVFVGCEPKNAHAYIATIELGRHKGGPDESINEIIERAKKKYPNFDAIIIKDFKFEKADIIKFSELELSGGGFTVDDHVMYQDGSRPKYGKIMRLDNPRQKAGFGYLDMYGEEKLILVPYNKLSKISKEQYDKSIEELNMDLQKHQFIIGQKVSFLIYKKSKYGEVVKLDNKDHSATIRYLGVFAEYITLKRDYFEVDKISDEKYDEETDKCRKEALQYKFEVGEKVVWKKGSLLGLKSEAINAEVVSLNELEHKATIKYRIKDNIEKQETISYLNLSKAE